MVIKSAEKFTIFITSIVTMITFIDTHAILPILSLYASELGATTTMVGIIVGAYSLVHTPLNIPLGRLADKIGRRLSIVIGLVSDAISMLLYSLSTLPFHLLCVRVFHGIGGSLNTPATLTVAGDVAPVRRRGRMMAIYGISISIALIIGYSTSGIIASRLGYKALFLIYAATVIGGIALAALFLPETMRKVPKVRSSGIRSDVSKFFDLITRRNLVACYGTTFSYMFVRGVLTVLLPLFIVHILGVVERAARMWVGVLFTVTVVAFIILAYPFGRLSDRIGRKIPATLGVLVIAIALFLIPFSNTLSSLAMLLALYGVGEALLFPALTAVVAENTTIEERGFASGMFFALYTGGVAVGGPISGLAGDLLGLGGGLQVCAIVPLFGILAASLLVEKK